MSEWIFGNRNLTLSEMQNNALLVKNYLRGKGWTYNAIAGLLGNMEVESFINPGIWQGLEEGANGGGGFGLVQWTPWTNFTNWADEHEYEHDDGYAQLKWIDEVTVSAGQWIKTDEYDLSFEEFKKSNATPEWLALAFMYNFERPKDPSITEESRQADAREWYEYIYEYEGPSGSYPKVKKRKGFNFLLLCRRRREQRWH